MSSLRIKELHSVYQTVDHEEAIAIANLGAQTYLSAKEGLFELWNTSQSAEEGEKADVWRREGGQAMMESLKSRLAAGEAAQARMLVLQASVEAEVEQRMKGILVSARKDFELAKMDEIHVLEKKLAELKGKEHAYKLIDDAHTSMKHTIESLQAEVAKYKEATSTKTSHMLGKIGESELFDMLQEYVLPKFPYSEIKDMTAVKRAADFHVWLMSPSGIRVKLLLDAKKYKEPVPNIEIDKLYSDIDADTEAKGGAMVSLDTAIYARSQFQITRTPKNKLCMFLTFENMDDGIRREVLSWALRVMVGIVSVQDTDKRDIMIEKIGWFMKELGHSVTDIEGSMKLCKTLSESLRAAKENLIDRMNAYNLACGMDIAKEEVTHTEIALSARCKGVKPNGERCKFRHNVKSEYCSRHTGGGDTISAI